MNRTRRATVALAATTIAVSGCGGSPRQSGTAKPASTSSAAVSLPNREAPAHTGPLTRAELIAQADTICGRLNHKQVLMKSRAELGTLLPPLAAYQRAGVAQMRQLIPPASMAKDWRQMVAGAQAMADVTSALGAYARVHRFTEAKSLLEKQTRAQNQLLAAAKRAGFKECDTRPF